MSVRTKYFALTYVIFCLVVYASVYLLFVDYRVLQPKYEIQERRKWLVNEKPYLDLVISRSEIREMINEEKFVELDQYLYRLKNMYDSGIMHETPYIRLIDKVSGSDQRYLEQIEKWIGKTDSGFAHQARGETLRSIGWDIRGTEFAHKVSREDMKSFKDYQLLAFESFKMALDRDPTLIYSYGRIQSSLGPLDHSDTDFWLAQAEKHTPNSIYPFKVHIRYLKPRWGGSYIQMRWFAIKQMHKWSSNPDFRELLGAEWSDKADILFKEEQYEEAVAMYKQAQYHGDNVGWWIDACESAYKSKNYGEVIEICKEGLSIKPHSYGLIKYLSLGLRKEKRYSEAKDTLAVGIQYHPTRAYFYYLLGRTQLKTNDIKAAIDSLAKSVELQGEWPIYRYWYGDALADNGELGLASEHIKKFLDLCEKRDCSSKKIESAELFLANSRSEI